MLEPFYVITSKKSDVDHMSLLRRAHHPPPSLFEPALCVSISSQKAAPIYGDDEATRTRLTAWLTFKN
jgi:hypothetical protein